MIKHIIMYNKYICAFTLIIIMMMIISSSGQSEDTPMSTLSLSKLDRGAGLTMNILYCYSCGYRKAFDDYASIIQQQFPEISVHGANYDPPGVNMYLSRFISIAKILLIASILSGFYVFEMFNQREPAWYRWCKENKIYACMMVFFLSNTIESQLVSSGAFEIFLNNIPVWSKLETGRIPQVSELFQIIQNTLQFTTDAVTPGYVK